MTQFRLPQKTRDELAAIAERIHGSMTDAVIEAVATRAVLDQKIFTGVANPLADKIPPSTILKNVNMPAIHVPVGELAAARIGRQPIARPSEAKK